VLVGVGSPAFLRQAAIAEIREASALGSDGVPVTVTDGAVVALTVGLVAGADVEVVPSDDADDPDEQAVSAGTASAATAAIGTSVRNGATDPPRQGRSPGRDTHSAASHERD
jgi:hypothetical protein